MGLSSGLSTGLRSSLSQVLGGRRSGGGTQEPVDVLILLMAGESNSGGFGNNDDLAASKKTPNTRTLQIWDNVDEAWEDLEIGVNNITGHVGLSAATSHGIEAALADLVDEGLFGSLDVRLMKVGNGGSHIVNWTGDDETLQTRMIERTDSAIAALSGQSHRVLFWWSQGINDSAGNTLSAITAAEWKPLTVQFFSEVRSQYGADTIIVATELPPTYTAYNAALAEIAAADSRLYIAETTDAQLRDTNHWSANGWITIAPRMLSPFFKRNNQLRLLGPVIYTQPADKTVTEGISAEFLVSVESLDSVSYQWQLSTDNGSNWSNISGANASSYSSVMPIENDENQYRCQVTANGATRTSRVATVTVTAEVTYDPETDLSAKLIARYVAGSGIYDDINGGTTTPVTTNNGLIGTWVSRIGTHHFAVPVNPANKFTWIEADSNANGKPAVQNLTAAYGLYGSANLNVKCIVIVARYEGATFQWEFPTLIDIGTGSAGKPTLVGTAAGGTTFISSSTFLSPWEYRVNGVVSTTYDAPMNAAKILEVNDPTATSGFPWRLSQNANVSNRGWRGQYYEILFFNDQLTTAERTSLNSYLAAEYGITL
jgi:hypothetical protein